MKQFLRKILRKAGFELLHRTDDSVLGELRTLHETLRLDPANRVRWDDALPQPAAHAHLRHLLQLHKIDLVLDVGANRGQFARLLRELGYAGEIISFEPLAHNQAALTAAARQDGNWKIVQSALGETSGEVPFHVYKEDAFSSLHSINAAGVNRFQQLVTEDHVERVPIHPLDELWAGLSGGRPRRVFLKTDTQGHDLAVLSGATEVLRSTHAVMTEAAVQPIYADVPLYGAMVAWLESRGFAVSGFYPISHRSEDLALIEMDAFFTRRP